MQTTSHWKFPEWLIWRTCQVTLVTVALASMSVSMAQVNSGSDGSDGALNTGFGGPPLVIDLNVHPDGIFQYTSVNILAGTTVSFIPNARNTPVIWLVQSDCIIDGTVNISGADGNTRVGGSGGPGGFRGGNAGRTGNPSTSGQGPGGGTATQTIPLGANASYGTAGTRYSIEAQEAPGSTYGGDFLLPLIGGSGGGGVRVEIPDVLNPAGAGGGGGGALLIVANRIVVNGRIAANGGSTPTDNYVGGAGSGGSVRLVANHLEGNGTIDASGGTCGTPLQFVYSAAGNGRVRLDTLDSHFSGSILGTSSRGFQPLILPAPGQGIQLRIAAVAGVNVPSNPSTLLANPAVVIPAQQANPVPIVVACNGIPLNSTITVTVRPSDGPPITATGSNDLGTPQSSTAQVSITMPRGGGIIFARAIVGVGGNQGAGIKAGAKKASYAQAGLTADGERFTKLEITAALNGRQEIAYITESGKRYALAPQ